MDVTSVPRIVGALMFRPEPHVDERGFFCRTFDSKVMRAAGIDPHAFVQDSFELNDREQATLYVPAGCAHGFQALSEPADVCYRMDREYDPSQDLAVAHDDPELAIAWPLPVTVMSPRDRHAPPLAAMQAGRLLRHPDVPVHYAKSRLVPSRRRRLDLFNRRIRPGEHAGTDECAAAGRRGQRCAQ